MNQEGDIMAVQIGITATEFPDLSIEEIFKKAKEYGAQAIEIVQKKNIEKKNLPEVKRLIDKYSIASVSINNYFANLDESSPDKIEEAKFLFMESINMAEYLGAKFIVTYCFCEGFGRLENYIKNLRPLLKACEEKGIILALENEPGGITKTARGILKVIETINSPHFKINYDPDNFYNGGEEGFPYAYEILKEHIVYIHAKDSVKYDEKIYGTKDKVLHRTIDAVCVTIGEGALNWERMARRIKEDKFDGPIIIEPHTIPEKLDTTFKNGIQYLRTRGL